MTVLEYAARMEMGFEKQLQEVGKERKTTFFSDFSIADCYGANSVKDTYNRAIKAWIGDVEYMAEFILVLNWKSWEHHSKGNAELTKLYTTLYEKALNKAYKHYAKDKEATSYLYGYLD